MRPRQLPNLGALATFEVAAKHLSFTQAAREPPLQTAHTALFPDARMVTIPEAGHDTVWDQPKGTLRAIRSFLAATPSTDE